MKRIGIDIGGTQLRCAIFNSDGNLLSRFRTANDRSIKAEENADKIINFIQDQSGPFDRIGIGCAGPLDMKTGRILNPPNMLRWHNFPVTDFFESKTGIRTILNNDANVAGLAEARLGAGIGYESVFYITISTGIGGAFIYRGELINGAHSIAGEIYNLIVNEDPFRNDQVNAGAINFQCGGEGLKRIASAVYDREVDSQTLLELYCQEEESAVKVVDRWVDTMAKAVANISCTVDPEVFVIGGSIAVNHPFLIERIAAASKKYAILPQSLILKPAVLGDDAGLFGAMMLSS